MYSEDPLFVERCCSKFDNKSTERLNIYFCVDDLSRVNFRRNVCSKINSISVINEFTVGQIYSNEATFSNPQGKLTLMKNGLTKLNNRSTASVDARFLCPPILFVKFGSMVTMARN